MKDRKITRVKLKELYNYFKSCNKWSTIIANILIEETGTNIIISGNKLQEAWDEATNNQKKLISKYFKIEVPENILDKYNTWDKIVKKLGKENCILPFNSPKTDEEKSINARVQLARIIKVHNDGYVFDWKNINQYKYWIYKYQPGGVAVVSTCDPWAGSHAVGPVDLAIRNYKIGENIIKNFPKIINDYFMI